VGCEFDEVIDGGQHLGLQGLSMSRVFDRQMLMDFQLDAEIMASGKLLAQDGNQGVGIAPIGIASAHPQLRATRSEILLPVTAEA